MSPQTGELARLRPAQAAQWTGSWGFSTCWDVLETLVVARYLSVYAVLKRLHQQEPLDMLPKLS